MLKKLMLSSCCLCLSLLSLPSSVAAQSSQMIKITPVVIDAKLQAGKPYEQQVTLENLLDVPLGITVSIEDFEPNGEESEISIKEQMNASPLIMWTTFSKKDMIISPKGSENIVVTITPPPSTSQGGYYAMAFITPFFTKPRDPTKPTILSKVGILTLGTIGQQDAKQAKQKVQISDILVGNQTAGKTPISFRVKNEYFTFFTAKPKVTIKPLWGKEHTYNFQDKRVLPGKVRKWTENIVFESTPPLWYTAKVAASVGEGEYVFAEKTVTPFSQTKIIYIALGVIGAVILFVFRKRVARVYAALLGKHKQNK